MVFPRLRFEEAPEGERMRKSAVSGICEINLHGMKAETAKRALEHAVLKADGSIYRIRVIHGYHGGTVLRDWIQERYGKGGDLKVKRIEPGSNPGVSDLVLREY